MDSKTFVYVTYIRTTPERLWQALTEAAFTERYWGVRLESGWAKASPLVWTQAGVTVADPEQVVLVADAPRQLAYTWHTFTPRWAESVGLGEDVRARIAAERRSSVTFTVEPLREQVKLTVTHDFDPAGVVHGMCTEGWPPILSSLKTLLETGEPLPAP
ncbi:SRPBCC family protein [Streptomyces sp. NBC_00083]|uniref:SRPBCC family protein n=1 Tax=Streptomyces sp. NBC_00083 TaxID=2975647 RepID=UPI00224EFDCE|nr:SRPBCC family protein [Streptomyces sp. NBC_00083]MCX5386938.1 SRPBCC family protein [Streptomyces sp. NBC_00083]